MSQQSAPLARSQRHEPPPSDFEGLLGDRVWLGRLARSLTGDEALAEDAIQETYLAALAHPPRAQGGSGRGWLATVLRNRLRSHARRSRHPSTPSAIAGEPADPAPSPEALVAEMELRRLLAELVLALSPPLREALLLTAVEGLTSEAAAARLGVAAGTIRWRVKTALDEIRTELDRRHAGDRRRWLVLLQPFAGPKRPPPLRPPIRPILASVVAGTVIAVVVASGSVAPKSHRDKSKEGAGAGAGAATATAFLPDQTQKRDATGTATVEGVVEDPNGRPVAGAAVATLVRPKPFLRPLVNRLPRPTRTDSNGRYRIGGLAPGEYDLVASSEAGSPAARTLRLTAGATATVNLRLHAGGATLSGRLLDQGTPATGGRVLVIPRQLPPIDWQRRVPVTADSNGRFRVQLPAGTYHLLAEAEGYAVRRGRRRRRVTHRARRAPGPGGHRCRTSQLRGRPLGQRRGRALRVPWPSLRNAPGRRRR